MRTILIAALLAVGVSIACAGRTVTSAGPAQQGSTGAQAAAKLTVQEYDAFEKKIGTGFSGLQMQLAARDGQNASKEAAQMAVVFGDVEQFWAQNHKPDAVKWAQQSAMFASQIAGAVTAGDFTKAKQAQANLERTCNQCHGAYRQTDAAGGFAVKGVAQ
jgi:hypothetical protein